MIRGFEPSKPAEPEQKDHLQWTPAIGAGLISGVLLLIVPHGSPWEGLSAFAPVVMGRAIPTAWNFPPYDTRVIHLAIAVIYGVIVSLAVVNIHQMRAVLAGAVVGLVLYVLNFFVVRLWFPALSGNEVPVVVAHAVFGLIAAGAYRGLLRRKAAGGVS